MEEKNYYIYNEINEEEALELYVKKIKEDLRYINIVDHNIITIDEEYYLYYFFDGNIINHRYYYIDKNKNIKTDGKIDVYSIKSDSFFLLNNLDKTTFLKIEKDYEKYAKEDEYKNKLKEYVEEVKDRALTVVCQKHNTKPSKHVHIDIDLISGFTTLRVDIYIEKVFVIRYRSQDRKNDYVSVLSSFKKDFYEFDYIKNDEYISYLKLYKRPLSYIPKNLIDYYYLDGFKVYQNVKKKLEYETEVTILKKIKENILYEDYSAYNEYLYSGVFYFKINSYLKKLNCDSIELKKKIYLSYLTLNHQPLSGLFLYECAIIGLLEDNSIYNKIRFLNSSFKLKNVMAKRLLYEHYKNPRYYDEKLIKRYI